MDMDSKIINTLLAATLIFGLLGLNNMARADAPVNTPASTANMEKCYGIAKAGMNDCDTSDFGNCDKSVIDGDPNYWIYVPKGLCNKIVGGLTNIGTKSQGLPAVSTPIDNSTVPAAATGAASTSPATPAATPTVTPVPANAPKN